MWPDRLLEKIYTASRNRTPVPLEVWQVAITFLVCTALSSLAFYKRVLTWDGSLAAFVVGFAIGVLGDVAWLLLLLFFLLSSFLATRYRFALKRAMGVQEGESGERRSTNVLANGLALVGVAAVAAFNPPWLPRMGAGVVFLSALGVAGADTMASEIGVLSRRTVLITTGRRVAPGTNGGISGLGEAAALGASLYTAVIGALVLGVLEPRVGLPATMPATLEAAAIPALVGFVGCQVDSVLGATLEQRGWMDKKSVNLVATSLGAFLAYLLYAATFGRA